MQFCVARGLILSPFVRSGFVNIATNEMYYPGWGGHFYSNITNTSSSNKTLGLVFTNTELIFFDDYSRHQPFSLRCLAIE